MVIVPSQEPTSPVAQGQNLATLSRRCFVATPFNVQRAAATPLPAPAPSPTPISHTSPEQQFNPRPLTAPINKQTPRATEHVRRTSRPSVCPSVKQPLPQDRTANRPLVSVDPGPRPRALVGRKLRIRRAGFEVVAVRVCRFRNYASLGGRPRDGCVQIGTPR